MTAPCLHYWDVVDPQTRRLAVHGGWLYMVVCYSGDGVSAIPSTAFVADPTAPHVAPVPSVVPVAAPAEVPAWRADADAAVALLMRAGWADAQHDDDASVTYVYAVDGEEAVVTTTGVYRPGDPADGDRFCDRAGRTLTECARLVIRDAVERGEAPDMDAACAMVAEWDAAGGGA